LIRPHNIRFRFLALLLACNYFAFRTELCEDEYEDNHPQLYDGISITVNSTNWETFDKDNAPKAFVFQPPQPGIVIWYISPPENHVSPSRESFQLVRDKSPPCSIATSTNS
jgi:hypothetical protein